MIALYAELCDRYPIVSIEDGLAEDDWEGWQSSPRPRQPRAAGRRRPLRDERELPRARDRGRRRQRDSGQGQPDRDADGNARLHRDGAKRGIPDVISHRSGETEDTTIADIAVATGPANQDRIAFAQRSDVEVQSPDGDRGSARAGSALSRSQGFRTGACSSAVERPAHNWLRVGSNPTRPTIKCRPSRNNPERLYRAASRRTRI